ncbi:hypothetical protein [Bartonella sp. AA23NXGY]|uniref:hypothetical protein n=1 Tax=Bartonella sp. AA23NXGY TaxID=3243431 RepID=UPI0035CF28B9
MVVARDMFLKGLVFGGVVGLVPFLLWRGVRCVRVLLGWCLKRMSIFLSHGRDL